MLSRRTLMFASLSAVLVASLAGAAAYVRSDVALAAKDVDGWRPIAWPFPRDGWDEGLAWRGHGLEVYVRPKLGFCSNCDTGVVEDSEVDRVTDIDLVDPLFVPDEPGQRIQITDLVGRSRVYRLRTRRDARFAQGIAVNHNCDLVVALVVGRVLDEDARHRARLFLESDAVQIWLNKQLGDD